MELVVVYLGDMDFDNRALAEGDGEPEGQVDRLVFLDVGFGMVQVGELAVLMAFYEEFGVDGLFFSEDVVNVPVTVGVTSGRHYISIIACGERERRGIGKSGANNDKIERQ